MSPVAICSALASCPYPQPTHAGLRLLDGLCSGAGAAGSRSFASASSVAEDLEEVEFDEVWETSMALVHSRSLAVGGAALSVLLTLLERDHPSSAALFPSAPPTTRLNLPRSTRNANPSSNRGGRLPQSDPAAMEVYGDFDLDGSNEVSAPYPIHPAAPLHTHTHTYTPTNRNTLARGANRASFSWGVEEKVTDSEPDSCSWIQVPLKEPFQQHVSTSEAAAAAHVNKQLARACHLAWTLQVLSH
jgi:hypothetical protein